MTAVGLGQQGSQAVGLGLEVRVTVVPNSFTIYP